MDMEGLLCKELPPAAIIKNFVQGESLCNYEYYLIELLNSSKWFSNVFSEKFVWQCNQSKGECDAYSGHYGLDFKLITSQTRLQAKSIFSNQITLLADGVAAYHTCKVPGQTIRATRLHAALRKCSLKDLQDIYSGKFQYQTAEYDIQAYLKSLDTNKNVLLFFPFRFSYDNIHKPNNPEKTVVEAINHDFSTSFSFRSLVAPRFDTFFVTILDSEFLLMHIENDKAVYLESISTEKCPTFIHLIDYYDSW